MGANVFRSRNKISNRRIWAALWCLLIATAAGAQDVGDGNITGDLNTNVGANATVDSNNATESVTNNYNATGAGSPAPVPSAISPTVMGGGGNDSCLIPRSTGIQVTMFGISSGAMVQDPECNRRKDARLLGAPQAAGGLGLQVSGISVMCNSPEVFRAMALASTPCPLFDVNKNRLLTGRDAFEAMRGNPEVFVVGYAQDRAFWNAFLQIGVPLDEIEIVGRVPISERFRTSVRRSNDDQSASDRAEVSRPSGAGE